MALPPAQWNNSEAYRKARDYVCHVKVTNDIGERGIRMATDFMQVLTRDSDMRQKVFQVVEWDRRMRPDVNKSTMNK